MSDEHETTGLTELEAALAALSPRPALIDRDAIMYRAGRAHMDRWRWATALSSLVAAALAVTLLVRPPIERIVAVPRPTGPAVERTQPAGKDVEASKFSEESGPARYFRLQEQLLSRGLDSLPPLETGSDPTGTLTTEELLRGL
jgi:hypothetical protein